jgi:hypothetical protein
LSRLFTTCALRDEMALAEHSYCPTSAGSIEYRTTILSVPRSECGREACGTQMPPYCSKDNSRHVKRVSSRPHFRVERSLVYFPSMHGTTRFPVQRAVQAVEYCSKAKHGRHLEVVPSVQSPFYIPTTHALSSIIASGSTTPTTTTTTSAPTSFHTQRATHGWISIQYYAGCQPTNAASQRGGPLGRGSKFHGQLERLLGRHDVGYQSARRPGGALWTGSRLRLSGRCAGLGCAMLDAWQLTINVNG